MRLGFRFKLCGGSSSRTGRSVLAPLSTRFCPWGSQHCLGARGSSGEEDFDQKRYSNHRSCRSETLVSRSTRGQAASGR